MSILEEILCQAFIKPQCAPSHKQHEEKQGRALTWGSHKSKSQSLIFMFFFFLNHKRWRVPLWAQDLTSKDFRDPWAWLLSQAPCCEVAKGKTSSPLATVNIFQGCDSIGEMPSCQQALQGPHCCEASLNFELPEHKGSSSALTTSRVYGEGMNEARMIQLSGLLGPVA